jgi:glutathione S-transferase
METIMTITFYDFKRAPSPRRARIMLAEKNVPHEKVEIDMMTAEQMSDSYRAINPNCTIPALKIASGEVLTDTASISVYLEDTYPEPALMGKTTMEKAEIASWNFQVESEMGGAIPNALRNTNPGMVDRALPGPVNYKQIPELAERGMQQIDAFMAKLEKRLEGRDFIAANQLSVADITAVCFLDFAKVVGKRISDDFPNILRWRAALAERPSFNL